MAVVGVRSTSGTFPLLLACLAWQQALGSGAASSEAAVKGAQHAKGMSQQVRAPHSPPLL